MFAKPADEVIFAEKDVENSFLSLPENSEIKKAIYRVIDKLKENAFCGKNIPKKQIPKEYIKKHGVDNLWWYPLPSGWRLIYFIVTPSNAEILAVILEYFNHNEYERRFKY